MSDARAGRRDGWWYPYIFVAGFGVVLAVNMTLLYFATSTFSGLDTERHYDRGITFNRELEAARDQALQGWRFELTVETLEPLGEGRLARLRVSAADRNGEPLSGLTLDAKLRRPATSSLDQTAILKSLGGGAYRADLDLPQPGLWEVRLIAARSGATHEQRFRVTLP